MKFRERIATEFLYVHLQNTKGQSVKDLCKEARREGKLHIGYHFVIQKNGTVEQGRDTSVIAGHDLENSERSIYVLVDTGRDGRITDSQRMSLNDLMSSLNQKYPGVKQIVE